MSIQFSCLPRIHGWPSQASRQDTARDARRGMLKLGWAVWEQYRKCVKRNRRTLSGQCKRSCNGFRHVKNCRGPGCFWVWHCGTWCRWGASHLSEAASCTHTKVFSTLELHIQFASLTHSLRNMVVSSQANGQIFCHLRLNRTPIEVLEAFLWMAIVFHLLILVFGQSCVTWAKNNCFVQLLAIYSMALFCCQTKFTWMPVLPRPGTNIETSCRLHSTLLYKFGALNFVEYVLQASTVGILRSWRCWCRLRHRICQVSNNECSAVRLTWSHCIIIKSVKKPVN